MASGCARRLRPNDSVRWRSGSDERESAILSRMTTPPDHLDLDALPDRVRAVVIAERKARMEAQERADRLEHLLEEFKRALFGRKSEKISADQLQLALEELETAAAETQAKATEAEAEAKTDAKAKSKRPAARNLGHLPKELPRIEHTIEPDSILCPCGCGEMKKIGEDRSERLDITPAQYRVMVTIRPIYACARNCDGKPVQAPAPAHLIGSALPTEGTIAHVLVSKYADHLPLYRQSQIFARSGLDLHRSTLADWCGKAAFHLRPIVERMAEQIKTSGRLFMDETPAPILDPGRGKTKTGYLWALARDDRGWDGSASNSEAVGQTKAKDPPAVIFHYADGRGGRHAEDFLHGFNGILQVDGYQGYDRLTRAERTGGEPLTLAYCWTHARRKLYDLADSSAIAREGLARIAELYAIEAEIRGKTAAERLSVRRQRSEPLVEALGTWLKQQRARISAKSRLGEKLAYIANHWEGLQVFLADGRVDMDTNLVENPIRSIALNRKNALFAGHDEGGKSWGLIASLIGTCKLNQVNPFDYLKSTLEKLANGHPQSKLDELMPWAFGTRSS
jgi:transposase